MPLSPPDAKALYNALLEAFPRPEELERMLLLELGVRLPEIATGPLADQVFAVIRWMDRQGRTRELVRAALAANPGSPQLQALASIGDAAVASASPATPYGATAARAKRALRDAIERGYSLEEMAALCADVEERVQESGRAVRVSLDDIRGSTRAAKALGLVEYLERRGVLDTLQEIVRAQRPGLL